jgi:hypothetical protein
MSNDKAKAMNIYALVMSILIILYFVFAIVIYEDMLLLLAILYLILAYADFTHERKVKKLSKLSNIIQLSRLVTLGFASAYIMQLAYHAYIVAEVGLVYWGADWGLIHGEPYIIFILGVIVMIEALLPYFVKLDYRSK